MNALKNLQDWYLSYCDSDWEHEFGVKIGTLDNPGWTIEIDLIGTKNEGINFTKIKIERTEDDWLHCWVEKEVFHAACGPLNLEEVLEVFLKWAKNK